MVAGSASSGNNKTRIIRSIQQQAMAHYKTDSSCAVTLQILQSYQAPDGFRDNFEETSCEAVSIVRPIVPTGSGTLGSA